MAEYIAFQKLNTPPTAPYDANTIYMVTTGVRPDDFELYISNSTGASVKKTLSRTAVDNLIANAIGGYDSGVIVADIAARDALSPTKYV